MLHFDEKELRRVLREELDLQHECRIPLDDNEVRELTSHFAQMRDIGGGSMSKGIQEMRDNHVWLSKQRKFGEGLIRKIEITIILSIISGILFAIWEGFKLLVKR